MNRLILLLMSSFVATTAQAAVQPVQTLTPHEAMRIVLGLVLVLGLIALLAWVIKKFHHLPFGGNQSFIILSQLGLGPKERIVLVKVASKHLLLGVTPASITLLNDFGETLPQGFEDRQDAGFSQILKSALRKKKDE